MKRILIDYNKCTGCAACAHICPKSAIRMIADAEGFRFPKIDDSKCIDCGVCKSVCTVYNTDDKAIFKNEVFACHSNNDEVRNNSSSGGMFYEIASSFLKKGGYVCAACYTENFDVAHKIISNEKDLGSLMKSKYIQSDINTTYKQIKELLHDDKEVFFTGTPCQVYGLKKYLKKDYSNLLCADIVCHGVPSYKVFKKFTDEVSQGGKLTGVDFRDKSNGWKNYNIKLDFDNNYTYFKKKEECLFFIGFVYNLYLRKSCYTCNFKGDNSYADVTLGDLWGADKLLSEMDDDKGLSVFIAHTEKALKVKEMLEDKTVFIKLQNDEYIKYNPSIVKSSEKNILREKFFKNVDKLGFSNTWDYINTKSFVNRLKLKIKYSIKN